jgi:hypothetical protein
MMTQFKAGDKVIRFHPGDSPEGKFGKVGEIYTVRDVYPYHLKLVELPENGVYKEYFYLAERPSDIQDGPIKTTYKAVKTIIPGTYHGLRVYAKRQDDDIIDIMLPEMGHDARSLRDLASVLISLAEYLEEDNV